MEMSPEDIMLSAVFDGRLDLIEQHYDPDEEYEWSDIITNAIDSENKEVIEWVIDHLTDQDDLQYAYHSLTGADVYYPDLIRDVIEKGGEDGAGYAVSQAMRFDDWSLIRYLLDRGDINLEILLQLAADDLDLPTAIRALELGATDVDAALRSLMGRLFVERDDWRPMFQLLKEHGADINVGLREAANKGRVDIVRELLELGAIDINGALEAARQGNIDSRKRLQIYDLLFLAGSKMSGWREPSWFTRLREGRAEV